MGRDRRNFRKLNVYKDQDDEDSMDNKERYDVEVNGEYELPEDFDADESIDEDEAFNSEDEALYGDVFMSIKDRKQSKGKGSKKGKGKSTAAANQASDDYSIDSEGPQEGISLQEMFRRTAPENQDKKKKKGRKGKKQDADDEDDDGINGMTEVPDFSDSDASDSNAGDTHANLIAAVTGKDRSTASTSVKRNKRRRDDVPGGLGPESEYGISLKHGEAGLSVGALMGALGDSKTTGISELKKQMGQLERAKPKKALAVPLSRPETERITRKTAYEKTSKDVTKWQNLVKKNREAETISFPLNPPKVNSVTSASLSSSFKPTTEMEKELDALLTESGMTEKQQKESEKLVLNKMTLEEAKKRRGELAKMRHLMHFYELKRKRANKIKSKAYHKIRKKQRLKAEAKNLEILRETDPEAAHQLEEAAERRRAEERLTLKHKNTSAWARNANRFASREAGTKQAIAEQLELGEQLRKKIRRESDSDDSSSALSLSGDEEDESDSGSDDDRQAKTALLWQKLKGKEVELPKKGLFSMKFMQRGIERQREEAEDLLKQLEEEEAALSSSSDEDEPAGAATGGRVTRARAAAAAAAGTPGASGRRTFGPSTTSSAAKSKDSDNKDDSNEDDEDDASDKVDDASGNNHRDTVLSKRKARTDAGMVEPISAPVRKKVKKGDGMDGNLFALQPFDANTPVSVTEVVKDRITAMKQRAQNNTNDDDDDDDSSARNDGDDASLSDSSSSSAGEDINASAQTPAKSAPESNRRITRSAAKRMSQDHDDQDEEEGDDDDGSSSGENPWLERSQATGAAGVSKRAGTKGKKAGSSKLKAKHDRELQIQVDSVIEKTVGKMISSGKKKKKKKKDDDDDDNDNDDVAKVSGKGTKGRRGFNLTADADAETKALINRAFANAGAETEFESEKADLIAEEEGGLEKKEAVLPGWGSWGGHGAPAPKPRRNKKQEEEEKKKKKPGADRQDAKLKHVIINERRDKKAAKYQTDTVPFPFKTREQYERSIRNPLGKDWNTTSVYNRLITPEVTTKMGAIIEPIRMTKAQLRAQKDTRKSLSGKR